MRQMILVATVALMGLSACSKNGAAMSGGGGLCTPFPTQAAAAPGSAAPDGSASVDDCLHRWSYGLAAASDGADLVARAAVAACSAPLMAWNQQMMGPADGASGPVPSLMTGEPTTALGEHQAFAQSRALFYAVQARAGKCAAPKIVNGAANVAEHY